MTKHKLVVCDMDEAYVEAFAAYLLERLEDVTISTYTDTSDFLQGDGNVYDIGILGKEFLYVMADSNMDNIREKLYLCDERVAEEFEYLPMVYKYQSMEIVEEMLKRINMKIGGSQWKNRDIDLKMTGIYSPVAHELQMPFGLALCQAYSEGGRILYVDIEELSIMQSLMHREGGKNMQDFFFYMKQDKEVSLGDFVATFMGIDYIRPFNNPEELNEITGEDWQGFFEVISRGGYDRVVVLFGRAIQGFAHILSDFDELIILTKQGDYYQRSNECFQDYLRKLNLQIKMDKITLPMNASNLNAGNFILEELVQGNLGMYVRRQIMNRESGVVNGVA